MEPFCVSGDAADVSEAKLIVGVEGVSPKVAPGFDPEIVSSGLAKPKSISFAPDFVSIMLAGLRSRWMMPWR